MKRRLAYVGMFGVIAMCCVGCGNSAKSEGISDKATEPTDTTEVAAVVEEQSVIDPNAPLTAEEEADVLNILKQIHIAQNSKDLDATVYFSKGLIQKIKEAPATHGGMMLGVCYYGGCGTERTEIDPESIKIIKFDPTTGKTKYKLTIKIIDDIDGSVFTSHQTETATFIREDGKIVLDKTSAETYLS